jgi:hypothetical protein
MLNIVVFLIGILTIEPPYQATTSVTYEMKSEVVTYMSTMCGTSEISWVIDNFTDQGYTETEALDTIFALVKEDAVQLGSARQVLYRKSDFTGKTLFVTYQGHLAYDTLYCWNR